MNLKKYLNKDLEIVIDRPKGSKHPKYNFLYEVNYGYLPKTKSSDGEEIDVYLLGIEKPVKNFKGKCIAIIHRLNDDDDKLIIVPPKTELTNKEIEEEIFFQEKWFKHSIIRSKNN